MGFEEDAIALAAEAQMQAERARSIREARLNEDGDMIAGFTNIVQKHGYIAVPIYAETYFRRGAVFLSKQFHEAVGVGWYLSVQGDGGMSSLVITTEGQTSHLGFLSTPSDRYRAPCGTTDRGLPRSGTFIKCWPLKGPDLTSTREEQLSGPRQQH